MLLRKHKDYRIRLALGQLFCVCGLVGIIAGGAIGGSGFFGLFLAESRILDFLNGFIIGLSSVLLGLSVVMSAAALVRLKKEADV